MAKIELDAINKLNESKQIETPAKVSELIPNIEEKSENVSEKHEEAKPEEKKEVRKVVVVKYIGNGIWMDDNKKLWCNHNTGATITNSKTFSYEEYEKREDIKFMVQYGEMTADIVEM